MRIPRTPNSSAVHNKTAYRDYYENCRTGAFFFIYLTWLETGCRESPEELCRLVRQIVKKTF